MSASAFASPAPLLLHRSSNLRPPPISLRRPAAPRSRPPRATADNTASSSPSPSSSSPSSPTRPSVPVSGPVSTSSKSPRTAAETEQQPVGLSGPPGRTGTTLANLFPIPILGAYGWFLTVYERDVAATNGAFIARFPRPGVIDFFFRRSARRLRGATGDAFRAFKGIATGNLNIRNALHALDATEDTPHEVRLFERGQSEFFFNRRVEVHVDSTTASNASVASASEADADADADAETEIETRVPSPIWDDPAPTYRVAARKPFEVRDIFPGGGAPARTPAKLEYFAMSLFPIPVLQRYGAFIAVWRQRRNTTPVAVDRVGPRLRLAPFDPLELPTGVAPPAPPAARFAVATFFGAVTDDVVAAQVKRLRQAIASAPDVDATAEEEFRVVVDSRPNTVTPNRKNELWIELQ